MKIIEFPYVLDAGDGNYYLLDVTDDTGVQEIIALADENCYMFEDPKIATDVGSTSAIYNALSKQKYDTLGYKTKEELFAAYDAVPEFKDSHAYSLDGLESAVIGVTSDGSRFVYDYNKMIEALQTNDDMTEEDALEWYSYNIERSFPYYQPCPIVLVSFCE